MRTSKGPFELDQDTRAVDEAQRAHADLVQAEKLDALRRMSGGVAHDFNNILQVVKSSLEIVQRNLRSPSAEVSTYLEMAKRNTERAARLSRRLLAFSGGQRLSPTRTDVHDAIPRMEGLGGSGADAVNVDMVLRANSAVITVDPAQLAAAIAELAANARDAMSGSGKLTIETRDCVLDSATVGPYENVRSGSYLAITVRDTGAGMSPEILARAWEPYFTTHGMDLGKGMGLAEVHGFAKRSGGWLRLESEAGRGTAVTLYLPQSPAGKAEDAERAADGARLQGLRIAVVEDELLVGILIEDLVQQLGCKVVATATSVTQALDSVAMPDLDLALLDINLQGQAVYPVAEALLERGVPFVFMSGAGHQDAHWIGWPMIQKPVQLKQVEHEIKRALAGATPKV